MNSYQHYSFGPTDTKICRLTFGCPVARDANDGIIFYTDGLASVVLAGGQPRVALATNKLTISCLGDVSGDNSFVQNDQFRREWVRVCTAIGGALHHTNLESVSIDMDHSFHIVQVAPGIVQMVVGEKSDWIISTILRPLRDIATLRSVRIATNLKLNGNFNRLELSLEAIASFINLESLVIDGFETMSPGSMTTLATALQTPTAFPALASLTLGPQVSNDVHPFQVGEKCPPELVEPFSTLVEAIRTKDTLYTVLACSDWIDYSTNVKLQTFPSIYRAIQASGLMPVPAPERCGRKDIRDLLLPPTGSPDPPTGVKWIRVMKKCISYIRDRLFLLLAGGSPNTPEDPIDALYKWIHAMQHFVEEEDQFACFHFFFSKIDATKYIKNPNLEAILSGEYVPRHLTIGMLGEEPEETRSQFLEWHLVIHQAILVCIAAVVVSLLWASYA